MATSDKPWTESGVNKVLSRRFGLPAIQIDPLIRAACHEVALMVRVETLREEAERE